jgi:hypothetical protein
MGQSEIPKIDPWPLGPDELPRSLTETLTAYQSAFARLQAEGAEFPAGELAVARRQLENLMTTLYEAHGLRPVPDE